MTTSGIFEAKAGTLLSSVHQYGSAIYWMGRHIQCARRLLYEKIQEADPE